MEKVMTNTLICIMGFFSFFLLITGAYAFVYDVEPVSPAKEYCLEKEVFDRTNDNWAREFPSYGDWISDREVREGRFHEWAADLAREIGDQATYSLDPWWSGIEHSGERDSSCRE